MNDLFRALFGGQLPEALCHPTKHQRSLYSFICGLAQTQRLYSTCEWKLEAHTVVERVTITLKPAWMSTFELRELLWLIIKTLHATSSDYHHKHAILPCNDLGKGGMQVESKLQHRCWQGCFIFAKVQKFGVSNLIYFFYWTFERCLIHNMACHFRLHDFGNLYDVRCHGDS